jgi:AcrR family transcriptional regulator
VRYPEPTTAIAVKEPALTTIACGPRHALGPANLRQRALLAAHPLLEARGAEGLNLRDIAAELRTGVASLYYHFANKDALLAELAIDGFRELQRTIAEALRAPRHRTPFHAGSDAYVHFARDRPALYALMYSERLLVNHPSVKAAESAAFEAFSLSLQGFGVPDEKLANVALTLWALGRGIGALSLSASASGQSAKVMTRRIVDGLSTLIGEPVKSRAAAQPLSPKPAQ